MRRDFISYPRAWAGDTSLRSCTRCLERRSRIASASFHLCAHCRVGRLRRRFRPRSGTSAGTNEREQGDKTANSSQSRRHPQLLARRTGDYATILRPICGRDSYEPSRLSGAESSGISNRAPGTPPPFLLPAIDGRDDAPLARPLLLEGGLKLSNRRPRLDAPP